MNIPSRNLILTGNLVKKSLFILIFLAASFCIFAQEESTSKSIKISLGLGPEFNMNSRENFAGGAVLNFGVNLGSSFAIGINATASYNFAKIFVIEPAAFFRWYFLSREHNGLFVQADAGAYLVFEDDDIIPLFMGGLRAGFRLPLGDMFFIEPYGRLGYPFMFGIGALVGVRL